MNRECSGFTLIEMLLALTLASLLTAALSMMIGQAAREREAMREQTHDPDWSEQLIDLLGHDLRQAQWWAGAEDRIVLIGLGRGGLPAQIEYRWVEYESGNAIVRKEVLLTESVAGQGKSDPSVIGVDLEVFFIGQFGFGDRLASGDVPEPKQLIGPGRPTLLINGQRVPLQPLPERLAIQVAKQEGAWPGLSREVVLH